MTTELVKSSDVAFSLFATNNYSTTTARDPADWLKEWMGINIEGDTPRVNEHTALNLSAFWAGVRIISESIASLPLHAYRRSEDDRISSERDTFVESVLRKPNQNTGSMLFRETLQSHALTWGNGYAEIVRDFAGNPLRLIQITPDRVKPYFTDGGQVAYEIYVDGAENRYLSQDRMLHIRGLGFDGLVGYSVVTMARRSLGISISAEEYGNRFFGNDSTPGGVLVHPGQLSENAAKLLKSSWEDKQRGKNRGRVAVLEEGMKFEPMSIPNADAQFLETRQFQISEIARWLNMPPHLLRDLSHATFSNIEEQSLEWVVYTLRPWLVRWEQELTDKLFRPKELRQGYFVEHSIDGLLRGNMESRYRAYTSAINTGWKTINEVRRLENLNPVEDGDELMIQGAMIPLSRALEEPPGPSPAPAPMPQDTPEDSPVDNVRERILRAAEAYVPILAADYERLLRIEADKAKRAEKQGKLSEWAKDFYRSHEQEVRNSITPTLDAWRVMVASLTPGLDPDGVLPESLSASVQSWAAKHVSTSMDALANSGVNTLENWSERATETAAKNMRFAAVLTANLVKGAK